MRTINDEIQTQIDHTINQQPTPTRCTITKVHSDNAHTDIETSKGKLTYIETIGNNLTVGNVGILIYLDGNFEKQIVITK